MEISPIAPSQTTTNILSLPTDILTLIFHRLIKVDQEAFSLTCHNFSVIANPLRFTFNSSTLSYLSSNPHHFFFHDSTHLSLLQLPGERIQIPISEPLIFAKKYNANTVLTVSSNGIITFWNLSDETSKQIPSHQETKKVIFTKNHLILIPQSGFTTPKYFSIETKTFSTNNQIKPFSSYWEDPQSLPSLSKQAIFFHPQNESITWQGKSHPLMVQYPYAVELKNQEIHIHTTKSETIKTLPCTSLEPKIWIDLDLLFLWQKEEKTLTVWDIYTDKQMKLLHLKVDDLLDLHFISSLRQINLLLQKKEKTHHAFLLKKIYVDN